MIELLDFGARARDTALDELEGPSRAELLDIARGNVEAMEAALNAARPRSGQLRGRVHVPAGMYLIDRTIRVPGDVFDSLVIQGDAGGSPGVRGTVFAWAGPDDDESAMFDLPGAHAMQIENLELECWFRAKYGFVVQPDYRAIPGGERKVGASGVIFRNVGVSKMRNADGAAGFAMGADPQRRPDDDQTDSCVWHDCWVEGDHESTRWPYRADGWATRRGGNVKAFALYNHRSANVRHHINWKASGHLLVSHPLFEGSRDSDIHLNGGLLRLLGGEAERSRQLITSEQGGGRNSATVSNFEWNGFTDESDIVISYLCGFLELIGCTLLNYRGQHVVVDGTADLTNEADPPGPGFDPAQLNGTRLVVETDTGGRHEIEFSAVSEVTHVVQQINRPQRPGIQASLILVRESGEHRLRLQARESDNMPSWIAIHDGSANALLGLTVGVESRRFNAQAKVRIDDPTPISTSNGGIQSRGNWYGNASAVAPIDNGGLAWLAPPDSFPQEGQISSEGDVGGRGGERARLQEIQGRVPSLLPLRLLTRGPVDGPNREPKAAWVHQAKLGRTCHVYRVLFRDWNAGQNITEGLEEHIYIDLPPRTRLVSAVLDTFHPYSRQREGALSLALVDSASRAELVRPHQVDHSADVSRTRPEAYGPIVSGNHRDDLGPGFNGPEAFPGGFMSPSGWRAAWTADLTLSVAAAEGPLGPLVSGGTFVYLITETHPGPEPSSELAFDFPREPGDPGHTSAGWVLGHAATSGTSSSGRSATSTRCPPGILPSRESASWQRPAPCLSI